VRAAAWGAPAGAAGPDGFFSVLEAVLLCGSAVRQSAKMANTEHRIRFVFMTCYL